jgi:hypothetical protein
MVLPGLIACIGLASANLALAIEPAKHTVAWYRTHQQAREAVLGPKPNKVLAESTIH